MAEIEFLKDLVVRASKLITDEVIIKAKDDKGDLVTNFDYEIEKFINNEIKKNYPTFDIVSEEFNTNNMLTENCFTVDPIDGTINFAHGMPFWAIQIACVKNEKTCAAVIFMPKLNEMYWADETGCYLNDKRIHTNNLPPDKSLYVVEGRNRLPSMVRLEKFARHYRVTYCAATNFAYVASGVFGGTIFRHENLWDYTPGQYLVKQAGGYIVNKKGCHIAANTKEMAELLEKYGTFFDNDQANATEVEEVFDVYDINGNHVGAKPKSFCHSDNPGVYHKPVWIWIVNDKGQILVQKRAATKKKSPNKYDMPSAGHVLAGETLLHACVRETEEELGLKCKESDFIFLKEWINQKGWEFAEIYLLKTKAKISDMKLQKEEVAEVKYLDYDEFVKLFYSDDFCNHAKEYKDWVCEVLKKYCK